MNEDLLMFMIFVIVTALTIGIIAWLVYFIIYFRKETAFICNRIDEADNDSEYDYWEKELRQHYLCLIPFVTEKNVGKLYNAIYKNKPKHKNNGIFHLIMPSLIGVLICAICLCQMSWAWFTASNIGTVSTIKTPNYSLDITVKNGTSVINGNENAYSLFGNVNYDVTVTAKGTDGATGYCKMTADGKTYYSEQIKVGNSISFKIRSHKGGDVIIEFGWGSLSHETREIKNGVTIDFVGDGNNYQISSETDNTTGESKRSESAFENEQTTTEIYGNGKNYDSPNTVKDDAVTEETEAHSTVVLNDDETVQTTNGE